MDKIEAVNIAAKYADAVKSKYHFSQKNVATHG
jgi:hypothetical protein